MESVAKIVNKEEGGRRYVMWCSWTKQRLGEDDGESIWVV